MELDWSVYPAIPTLSDAQIVKMGVEKAFEYWKKREDVIQLATDDPLNHGLEFESWGHADEMLLEHNELMCFGGNGGAKSRFGARSVVKAAMANPKAEIVCFAQDDDASIRIQQRYVYEFLPPELKQNIKSKTAYIKYSDKNGFTDGSLILPNGAKVYFHTYSQYLNNPKKFEGYEYGSRHAKWANLGLWLDEYLGDGDMINTIRLRVARRNAVILFTFTPIDGITEFVGKYYREAETLEWRDVDPELFPEKNAPKRVPYKQVNKKRNAGIIYFHTDRNPWGGYDRLKKDALNESIEFRITRAYGVPTKNLASLFPKFNKSVHVLEEDNMPDLTQGFTHYQVIDPAEAKNWFMIWCAVDANGTHYIYEEFPTVDNEGIWAKWGKAKWVAGDGAKGLGYGFKEYADLIREHEAPYEPFERVLDSRLGFSPKMGRDESSSIAYGLEVEGIECVASSGIHEAQGIQQLNDMLSYDQTKPIDALNCPKLFISAKCCNTIAAFGHYNCEGKVDEAWKDPIDCYDIETEVLTDTGWKRIADVDIRDTRVATLARNGDMEWQAPLEKIENMHDGEMIQCQTRSMDFMVTPNHRMLVYSHKTKKNSFVKAKELKKSHTIPCATNGITDDDGDRDDWFEFLGWYLGDGCCAGNMGGEIQIPGRGYEVLISQSQEVNSIKCNRIESLMYRLGFKYWYNGRAYVISSKELHRKLIGLGNCYTKRVPKFAFSAKRSEILAMLDGLRLSDGWKQNGEMRYASASEGLTSDVQALMQIVGIPTASIYTKKHPVCKLTRNKCQDQYWVSSKKLTKLSLVGRKKDFKPVSVNYTGMVYCLRVPNGTLIVRRNGKVMVCGNCVRYMATGDFEHITPGMMAGTSQTGGY